MNQPILFRCRCGSGLKEIDPEHTSFRWNSENFCSTYCIEQAQTLAKCQELGIPFQPQLPFIHPGGP